MKRWHLWVSVLALALFVFLASRDTLARLAWQHYHSGNIVIALDRHNSTLAMQIGTYYFGGGTYDLATAERAYRKAVAVAIRSARGIFFDKILAVV